MLRTLTKNWWLLALCGVLCGALSLLHLAMLDPVRSTVLVIGRFAIVAAVCAIAAGLWHSRRGGPWFLVLNGLALGVFGFLCLFWSSGRHGFLPVALLFVLMALSIGVPALRTARTVRRHAADEWFLIGAGSASIAFALAFLASGVGWIRFGQPGTYWEFVSSWFALSAIFMIGTGLRLRRFEATIHHRVARLMH